MNTDQTNDKPIVLRCNEDGLWEKYEPYMTIDCPTEEDYNFIVRALEHYKQSEGEWIQQMRPFDDFIVCSSCGEWFNIIDNCTEKFKFCPNCGAKMKGGAE